jgi:hypothetical protein
MAPWPSANAAIALAHHLPYKQDTDWWFMPAGPAAQEVPMVLRLGLVLGLALAGLGSAGSAASAAAWTAPPATAPRGPQAPAGGVVGTGIPGSCTEAALSSALAGGGTVTFNCGGPISITVATAQTITQATTIAGGNVITLTGAGTNRLFVVDPGASLTLQQITLDHGRVNGGPGGSIYSRGSLFLDRARIVNSEGHAGDSGGAIIAYGPLHINESVLSNNTAGFGGAVFADNFFGTARVVVTNSVFSGNRAINAAGKGGAIALGPGAHLAITDGALYSNSALQGGALYLFGNTVVTLTGEAGLSLIGNEGTWDGGAIFNNEGTLRIENVELSGNTTPTSTLAIGYGGAVYSSGTLFIFDSYLAHNEGRFGGAVCACGANPTSFAFIQGSTLALNTAGSLGGGFYSNTGVNVQIVETSFNGNTAGTGGGLARINSTLIVWRSSFTYNTAQAGGGLFLSTAPLDDHTIGGYVDVHDVTLSGNTATGTLGGAVYNTSLLQLYSATLKDNSSGLFNEAGADGRLRAAVLENIGPNCHGVAPTDDGANFATDLSCNFALSTQGSSLDARLQPLTADGLLTTYYHLPAPDSPLVNRGPAGAGQCATVDQRGLLRRGRCDIGAVEAQALWLPLVAR